MSPNRRVKIERLMLAMTFPEEMKMASGNRNRVLELTCSLISTRPDRRLERSIIEDLMDLSS